MMTKKIFISHRRDSGQATPEALLIQNILKRERGVNVFMDVTEDYLGAFPQTLKEKVKQSDSFVLVLPKADGYGYLTDPENWVHKEIKYALTYKDALNRPSRIVPVVFDRNFTFPSKEELGDISEIADYSFIYYDTNNTDSSSKLLRALGLKKQINPQLISFIIIGVLLLGAAVGIPLGTKSCTRQNASELYATAEVNAFSQSMHRFDSFNEFTDSAPSYVTRYFEWYLTTFEKGADRKINGEFNEAYVKDFCIRLIVLTYLAFSTTDLDKVFQNQEIDEYVNLCYDRIPKADRYPIGLKDRSREERTEEMTRIVDISFDTLNEDPRLESIDPSMLPILKSTILSKIWVGS